MAAAVAWLIASTALIVRGASSVVRSSWHAWALALGVALGVLKARLLLDRVAARAVMRIRARGRAPFLGFFSARSWLLIAIMMGAGMALRAVVGNDRFLAGVLGAVYIGVGTALLLADRAFWHAVFRSSATSEPVGSAATPSGPPAQADVPTPERRNDDPNAALKDAPTNGNRDRPDF